MSATAGGMRVAATWSRDAFDHDLLWDEPFAYVEDDGYAERYVAGAQEDIVWIGHEDWAQRRAPTPEPEKPRVAQPHPRKVRGWALRWAREVMLQRGEGDRLPARIEYNVAPEWPDDTPREPKPASIGWPTFADYDGEALDGYHDFVGRWRRFGKQTMGMRGDATWLCAVENRKPAIRFLVSHNRWPFSVYGLW